MLTRRIICSGCSIGIIPDGASGPWRTDRRGELPALRHPSLHYTLNGLVLKVSDKTGHWTGSIG